jgi:hypothetical protein
MKSSTAFVAAVAAAVTLLDTRPAAAQFRDGVSPVLTPPAAAASPTPPDLAPALAKAYVDAGRPRIALYWNRTLSSAIQSERYSRESTQLNASATETALDKQTDGPAGKATLHDGDEKLKASRLVTKTDGVAEDPGRPLPLSERDAALLEAMFTSCMARAGLSFVDRSIIVRANAVTEHAANPDPKTNEMQSLLKYADLLLQVLVVPDRDAPLGNGFQISLTDVRTGAKLHSAYSQAVPQLPPAGPGRWVATEHGYVYQAAARPRAGVDSIGLALGRDVTVILTQALSSVSAK